MKVWGFTTLGKTPVESQNVTTSTTTTTTTTTVVGSKTPHTDRDRSNMDVL